MSPRRRRVPAWQIERARLKGWQRDRRLADRPSPGGIDLALLDRSIARLALILRVEREARRCGCPTPYPLP